MFLEHIYIRTILPNYDNSKMTTQEWLLSKITMVIMTTAKDEYKYNDYDKNIDYR